MFDDDDDEGDDDEGVGGGVGYYSSDCSKPCPRHCSEGYCSREDGFCDCLPGLFGAKCDLPCPDDTWGPNCVHRCHCDGPHSLGCHPQVCRSRYVMFSLNFCFNSTFSVGYFTTLYLWCIRNSALRQYV